MHKVLTSLLILACLFSACRKDMDDIVVVDKKEHPNPGIVVTASVHGQVIDGNGLAIANAEVALSGQSVMTDDDGFYILRNIQTASRASLVTVTKNGFITGYRNLSLENNAVANVKFKLIEKLQVGVFNSSDGSNITFGESKLVFNSNTIVDEFGNDYNGQVNVTAHFYDPTASDFSSTIPGGLDALNAEGIEQTLVSYGMLAVELTDQSNSPLNIKEGETAELTFPIPENLRSSAPSEIPLWYLDESLGLWIEDGKAIKEGDKYVGEVSHFSFWNCDDPYNLIDFKLKATEIGSGNPLFDFKVTLTLDGSAGQTSGSGYTDKDGITRGKVPAGTIFKLTIEHDDCGIVYEATVGPYTGTVCEEVEIDMDLLNAKTVEIKGTLVDCDQVPIVNGYVVLTFDNGNKKALITDNNGVFSIDFFNCLDAKEVTANGFNAGTLKYSNDYTITIGSVTTFGNIIVCSELNEFLRLRLGNTIFTALSGKGNITEDNGIYNTHLEFNDFILQTGCPTGNQTGSMIITFESNSLMEGTYANDTLILPENFALNAGLNLPTIEITHFGDVGEFIEGNLKANDYTMLEWCSGSVGGGGSGDFELHFRVLREN